MGEKSKLFYDHIIEFPIYSFRDIKSEFRHIKDSLIKIKNHLLDFRKDYEGEYDDLKKGIWIGMGKILNYVPETSQNLYWELFYGTRNPKNILGYFIGINSSCDKSLDN